MEKIAPILSAVSMIAAVSFSAAQDLKLPSAEEEARMRQASPSKATAAPRKARKLLIISQCEGFTHSSVPYAEKAFEIMGRRTGAFTTVAVSDFAILEKPEFDTFDAIVMNNCTVRLPLLAIDTAGLNDVQKAEAEAREMRARKRFLDFVHMGKGLVGVHAATDCLYGWPEYGELIGGYFDGHPWSEDVRVKLDDPGHPLLAGFNGQDFTVGDEIYQFRSPYSRDTLRVLMSLDVDQTKMDKKGIKREDKDFAVAWLRESAKGRVFYFSLGHRHEIFWNASILQCYLDGIQYAFGDLSADATPSARLTGEYLEQSRSTAFYAGLKNMLVGLAGYELADSGTAQQLDAFVDAHMAADRPIRDALSKGLAEVAANTRATADGRAFACRKLSLVGTDDAVPVLAGLASDKALGNWVRYALARIPGPVADSALVDTLPKTGGADRVAIVALLGQRRVAAAIPALVRLIAADGATAVVAAEAIGRIGGRVAIDALAKLQPGAKDGVRQAVDRALLACGASARASGDTATAMAAYDCLGAAETAAHVRGAAFYGKNVLAGAAGSRAAVAALKGRDVELARAAARLVQDLPDTGVVSVVAPVLKALPAMNQVLVVDALAARGDRTAQDAVLGLVSSADAEVRVAALMALEALGDKTAVMTVIGIASAADVDDRSRDAARQTLNTMSGPGVDAAIAVAMRAADVKTKVEYVKVLGARKGRGALADLLAAARDADATLAREARKAIGLLAQAEDLSDLVGLLLESRGSTALGQLESIIVRAAQRADDERVQTAALLAGLKKTVSTEARSALLTALGRIGAHAGLSALTSAIVDTDTGAGVRRAAIKAVAEYWPDPTPMPALRDASRNDQDEGCRVLALRGYARMLAMPGKRPMKETLGLYREALDLAKGAQEKRTLIAGLGNLTHPDALAFVRPFLADAGVQAEALLAAVDITRNLNGRAMVLTGSVGQGTERNAIDASPRTRWTTGAPMVGGEWFMVDLGYETDIREVYLDAGQEGQDQPRGYTVHVSTDGQSWGEPAAKGGDPKEKAFTITFPPAYGRFVKVTQTGASGGLYWSINEIRVNGLPDIKGNTPLDRAKWKLSASRASNDAGPEHAIDGDLSTRWGTGGGMRPDDWFQVDLGEERTVHAVAMNAARSGNDYPRECRVYTSLDGKDWFGPIGAESGDGALTTVSLLPTKARYVKIAQTGTQDTTWWSIYDLQIMGE